MESGFYFFDGEELHFAPNTVNGPGFDLDRNNLDDRDNDLNGSDVHGWFWFDTEEEAKAFFNVE